MRRPVFDLPRDPLGLVGVALTTVSAALIVALFLLGTLGLGGGPYLGIVTFLVLPAFFVVGLLLIPVGARREHRRRARAAPGAPPPAFPVVDLNQPRTRRTALVVLALTAANVVLVAFVGYEAVHLMDTPAFCGSCHSVMDPESTTYRRSPHARVDCVACHIGPGAPWFVKSKLSGAWQVVSVNLDLYPRPIRTPVHDLRPARDTCEQCHWPAKFVGNRLQVVTTHDDDASSTARKTVLLVHVGGGEVGRAGIHWHVRQGVTVRYLSDPSRQQIGTVELTLADGTRRTFQPGDGPSTPGPQAIWRTMDCVDCHNRPSHVFRRPEAEVDQALDLGRIDASLPYVRREGVRALRVAYPSHQAARQGIARDLLAFYGRHEPAAFEARRPAIEAAARVLGDVYATDVWPSMRIAWGAYPSFLGHEAAPGCWRCHDGTHVAADGTSISQDCGQCHTILAQDEASPAILKDLQP